MNVLELRFPVLGNVEDVQAQQVSKSSSKAPTPPVKWEGMEAPENDGAQPPIAVSELASGFAQALGVPSLDDAVTESLSVGTVQEITELTHGLIGRIDKDALMRAIQKGGLGLEIDPERIHTTFARATEQFVSGLHSKKFQKILDAARKEETSWSEADIKLIKTVKRSGDLLRTAFRLGTEKGHPPLPLHQVVRDIGRLKDRMESGVSARAHANKVQKRRKRVSRTWLRTKFQAGHQDTLNESLRERSARIRSVLRPSSISAHDFHKVRKDLRDVRDWIRLELKFGEPNEEQHSHLIQLQNDFGQVQSALGDLQDALARANIRGEIDYDAFRLPVTYGMRRSVMAFARGLDVPFA